MDDFSNCEHEYFGVGSLGAALAGSVLEGGSFGTLFRLFAVLPLVALVAVFGINRIGGSAKN
ncbi:hypothetical protein [Halosolutus halophilus]|uniref:hypothetical protein n=1 Tax=Halosolutus halophilus TaxID=1552990 RepID=UPI0022350C7E|nr:hypothetical protein [Halosolutus halophilus]